MATDFKNKMRDLMKRAWMLVKVYGFSMGEAMKQAWLVLKLKTALKGGIVKFYYQKLDGEGNVWIGSKIKVFHFLN